MVTIYNADTWCDSCGRKIAESLEKPSYPKPWDSDDYPSIGHPEEATDSPQHCASGVTCLNRIDLREWGFRNDDPCYGAEAAFVGDLLGEELTKEGAQYLNEMLNEEPKTPYQGALRNLWKMAFAEYVEDEDEEEED